MDFINEKNILPDVNQMPNMFDSPMPEPELNTGSIHSVLPTTPELQLDVTPEFYKPYMRAVEDDRNGLSDPNDLNRVMNEISSTSSMRGDDIRSASNNLMNQDLNKISSTGTDVVVDSGVPLYETHIKLSDGSLLPRFEKGYIKGIDNEDYYARRQSEWERHYNAYQKMIAKTGINVIGGLGSIFSDVYNTIRDGGIDFESTNAFTDMLSDWNAKLDNSLPNYIRKEARDYNILESAFKDTGNFMNMLGEGVSFTAGAIVTALLTKKLTGGLGSLGARAGQASSLSRDAIGGVKTAWGRAMRNAAKSSIKGGNIGKAVDSGITLWNSSAYEAKMEQSMMMAEAEKNYFDRYFNENGHAPSQNEYSAFRKDLAERGRDVFLANMAIVGSSNAMMFGKFLGLGKPLGRVARSADDIAGSINKKLFGYGVDVKDGVASAVKPKAWQKGLARAKYITKGAITEGLWEEGAQGVASSAAKSYLDAKFSSDSVNGIPTLLGSIGEGVKHTYGTKEGWSEVGLGMLIGSMFGFLGSVRPSKRYASFEKMASQYNELNSLSNGLTYSSVNMFDRAVASSRLLSIEDNQSILSPETKRAIRSKMLIEKRMGVLEESSENFKNFIRNTTDEEFASQAEIRQIPKLIDEYKRKIIQEYDAMLEDFNMSEDYAESIVSGTPYEGTMFSDYIAETMFMGLQSGHDARSFAERIASFVGDNNIISSFEEWSSLSKEQVYRIERYKNLLNELESLSGEALSQKIISDKGAPEERIADIESRRVKLISDIDALKKEIESNQAVIETSNPALFNREVFLSGVSNIEHSPVGAEELVSSYEQIAGLEKMIDDMRDDNPNKKILMNLVEGYVTSIQNNRNILGAMQSMSDPRFMSNQYGLFTKMLKGVSGLENYKQDKIKGLDGSPSGIKAVIKGSFFGKKEIAYNIEKEIDDALKDKKISEDEAYTYKAYMNMLSTPIEVEGISGDIISDEEYEMFLSHGVSSDVINRVYSRAVVRGYDNLTQREKDILDVNESYKREAEVIRGLIPDTSSEQVISGIKSFKDRLNSPQEVINEITEDVFSQYTGEDIKEKKDNLSASIDAFINTESSEARAAHLNDILSILDELPYDVDNHASRLIYEMTRMSGVSETDAEVSDVGEMAMLSRIAGAGSAQEAKSGTVPMVSPIRILVRKKEDGMNTRFYVSHLNPTVFISRANNIMKSSGLPYRFVFRENIDCYVLVHKDTQDIVTPSEESGDTIYTVKVEPQYGQFSFNESTRRFLDKNLNIVFGTLSTDSDGDIVMDGVDYSIMYRRVIREDGVRFMPMQPNDVYGYLPPRGVVVSEEEDRRIKVSTPALNELSALVQNDPENAPAMMLIVDPLDEYTSDFVKEYVEIYNQVEESGNSEYVLEREQAKARLISQLVIQMRLGVDETSPLNSSNGSLVGVWRALGHGKSGYNTRVMAFNQLMDSYKKDEKGLFVVDESGMPISKKDGVLSVFTVKNESGQSIRVKAESSFPGRITFKHKQETDENAIEFHKPTDAEKRHIKGVGFVVRKGGHHTYYVNPTSDGSMDGINHDDIDTTYISLYDDGYRTPVIIVPHKMTIDGQNVVRYYALPFNLTKTHGDGVFANSVANLFRIGNTRKEFVDYLHSIEEDEGLFESREKLQYLLAVSGRTTVIRDTGRIFEDIMEAYDKAMFGVDGIGGKPNASVLFQNVSMPYNLTFGLKISDPQISVSHGEASPLESREYEQDDLPFGHEKITGVIGKRQAEEIMKVAKGKLRFNKDGTVVAETVIEFAKAVGIEIKEGHVFNSNDEFAEAMSKLGIGDDAVALIKNKRNKVKGLVFKGDSYFNAGVLKSEKDVISVVFHETAHLSIKEGIEEIKKRDVIKNDLYNVRTDFPATFAVATLANGLKKDSLMSKMMQLYIYKSAKNSIYYTNMYETLSDEVVGTASTAALYLVDEFIAHVVSDLASGVNVTSIVEDLNKWIKSANKDYGKTHKSDEIFFTEFDRSDIERLFDVIVNIYDNYGNAIFKNNDRRWGFSEPRSPKRGRGESDGSDAQGGSVLPSGSEQGAGELEGGYMGADKITPPERKLTLTERLEGKVSEKPMNIGDKVRSEIKRYKDGLEKKIVYDKRGFTSYLKGFNYDNIENLVRVAADILHGDVWSKEDERIRTILAHEILSRVKDVSTMLSPLEDLVSAVGPVMEGRKVVSKGIQIDSTSELIRSRLGKLNLFGHDGRLSVSGNLIFGNMTMPSVRMSSKVVSNIEEGSLAMDSPDSSSLADYDFVEEKELVKKPCTI